MGNPHSLQFAIARSKPSQSAMLFFDNGSCNNIDSPAFAFNGSCPRSLVTVSSLLMAAIPGLWMPSRVWPPPATTRYRRIVPTSNSEMIARLSRSQSYVTINGHSASLSWCQTPIWGPKTKFVLLSVAGLLMWCALSDDGTGLSFTNASGPQQCSNSWVRVSRDSWWYFAVSDARLSNLKDQVPVFISPGTGPCLEAPIGSPYIISAQTQQRAPPLLVPLVLRTCIC
jgi:hypothetical protein